MMHFCQSSRLVVVKGRLRRECEAKLVKSAGGRLEVPHAIGTSIVTMDKPAIDAMSVEKDRDIGLRKRSD